MRYYTRFDFGRVCGVSGILTLLFVPSAFSFEKQVPKNAARWLARDNCASYGPGFTSIEGTHDCARIGGHMRVEFGARTVTYYHEYAPAAAHPASTAMRGEGGFDFPPPRHVRVDDSDLVERYR